MTQSNEQLQQDNTEAGATEATTDNAAQNQQATESQTQATQSETASPLTAEKEQQSPLQQKADATPITYEAFTVPEGFALDEAQLGAFTEKVTGMELSQENAQVALDWHFTEVQKHFQQIADEAQAEQDANLKQWESNPKHAELTLKAQKAATRFFPELIDKFEVYGLAYDPAFLGALASVGDLISEGKMVEIGSSSEPKTQSPWDTTYAATKDALTKQGYILKD